MDRTRRKWAERFRVHLEILVTEADRWMTTSRGRPLERSRTRLNQATLPRTLTACQRNGVEMARARQWRHTSMRLNPLHGYARRGSGSLRLEGKALCRRKMSIRISFGRQGWTRRRLGIFKNSCEMVGLSLRE